MEKQHPEHGQHPPSGQLTLQGSDALVNTKDSNLTNVMSLPNESNPSTRPTSRVKTPSKRVFDWQSWPQEKLDQVAYNSHKQRKARLQLDPPKCPQCPEARFTSLAMLAIHKESKKHLARASNLEDGKPGIPSKKEDGSSDVDMAVHYVTSNVSTNQDITPTKALDMKRRKRRHERARKKSRARNADATKLGDTLVTGHRESAQPPKFLDMNMDTDKDLHSAATDSLSEHEQVVKPCNSSIGSSGNRSNLNPTRHAAPSEPPPNANAPATSSSDATIATNLPRVLDADERIAHLNRPSPPNSSRAVKKAALKKARDKRPSTRAKSSTCINGESSVALWNCVLCGSTWTKIKAWQGHLTSAQHMRHVVRSMQRAAPEIFPSKRIDVLASLDPFGWGTGAGVVEEEEEEEDEEGLEMGVDEEDDGEEEMDLGE